jgi:hypothetical protein
MRMLGARVRIEGSHSPVVDERLGARSDRAMGARTTTP